MKVSAAPNRVDDLLRFLRHMGYEAEEIGAGLVDVREPAEGAKHHVNVAAMALALQLRVWNAVNDGDAEVLDAGGRLEP